MKITVTYDRTLNRLIFTDINNQQLYLKLDLDGQYMADCLKKYINNLLEDKK